MKFIDSNCNLKDNNRFLYDYFTTLESLDTSVNKICVLLETAVRDVDDTQVQDILNEIVLALFDTHFKNSNYAERREKIMLMFEKSFANAIDFYEDDESESSENA